MNILFVVPPEKYYIESYVTKKLDKGREFRQKLGILYVAGTLREGTPFDVEVIDSLADGLDSSDIRRIIKEKKPDVVGFSVLTFNLLDCLDVAKIIREVSPSTKICFGGFHPTIYPQETLDFPEVDYVVFGEGEITFKELVKAIDLGGNMDSNLSTIDGVGWKNSLGTTFINKGRKAVPKLDEITMPAHDLIDLEKYTVVLANDSKVASIQTSRGCPSKCTFCDIRLTRFRFRSAENVLKEIEYLKTRGINEFFLVDDQFTSNKERVLKLCKLLINKNIQRHTVSPLLGAEGWAAEFTIVDAGVARSLLSRREGKGWQAGQRAHPLPPSRWGSSHGALPPCGRSRQRRQ